MRWSGRQIIVLGFVSLALIGCHPRKAKAPLPPIPAQPPEGWRTMHRITEHGLDSITFAPKERSFQESMWVTVITKPQYLKRTIDELFTNFRPIFICQNNDLKVLNKDPNEMTYEESDKLCYGRSYRLTYERIVKGPKSVTVFAYRGDVPEIPKDRRELILKTLAAAPLDKIKSNAQPGASTAAGASAAASPATAANSH